VVSSRDPRHAFRARGSSIYPYRSGGGAGSLIYVIVGAFVAGAHHYFAHVSTLRAIASALLALLLWPLILLGIDLHIR
jgi:predicted phage tail protein